MMRPRGFVCGRFLLFIVLAIGGALARAEHNEDALSRFARSYEWLDRVSFTVNTVNTYKTLPDVVEEVAVVWKNDGNSRWLRTGSSTYRSTITGNKVEYDGVPDVFCTLMDHANPLFYQGVSTDDDRHFVRVYEDPTRQLGFQLARADHGGMVAGRFSPFSHLPLPELMKEGSFTVTSEFVSGVQHEKIEGEIPEGHVSVWVAPEFGNALTRCVLVKERDKHMGRDGRPFNHVNPMFGENGEVIRSILEVNITDFELVDGFYVPQSGVYVYKEELANGHVSTTTTAFTVTDVDLHPDFSCPTSFKYELPANTKASYMRADGTVVSGFRWLDGEIVPQIPGAVVEAIEAAATASTANESHPSLNEEGQVTEPEMAYSAVAKGGTVLWACLMAAGTIIAAAVGIQAFRKSKEK